MIRPLSRTSLVLDIVGAFVLFAVAMPASLAFYAPGSLSTNASEAVAIAAAVVAGLLQCGAVAVGRLAPGIALGVAWLGAIVQMTAALGPLPINIAILAVLYATAAWGGTRTFWAGLGSVINLARQRYSTDMIFATVLLILIAVFLTDRLIFSRLQERIGKKYGV